MTIATYCLTWFSTSHLQPLWSVTHTATTVHPILISLYIISPLEVTSSSSLPKWWSSKLLRWYKRPFTVGLPQLTFSLVHYPTLYLATMLNIHYSDSQMPSHFVEYFKILLLLHYPHFSNSVQIFSFFLWRWVMVDIYNNTHFYVVIYLYICPHSFSRLWALGV